MLTALGLWPRSRALGPNWTRLPAAAAARKAIAITIDDGPDPEVTPRVLELLAREGVRATFFCIGEKVDRHPELCRVGLQLASWTRRGFDTRERDADKVLGRLLRNLGAGDILLLHDGNAARTADGTPVILAVLPRVIAAIRAAGLEPVTLRTAL
jgi:peptidoglycan/xylan/chitin deacetylase (PgdA/CDA1 family)